MSDSAVIWFILGPVLGFAIVIGWLTRNDPELLDAAKRNREELKRNKLFRVFQLVEVVGIFGTPIPLYYLFGALWGALLLIGLGTALSFRPNLARGSLMSEGVTRTTGFLYVVVGVIGVVFWVGGKA